MESITVKDASRIEVGDKDSIKVGPKTVTFKVLSITEYENEYEVELVRV